jgi:hypothetical protein
MNFNSAMQSNEALTQSPSDLTHFFDCPLPATETHLDSFYCSVGGDRVFWYPQASYNGRANTPVNIDGEWRLIGHRSYRLLDVLGIKAGVLVTQAELAREVWDDPNYKFTKTLNISVAVQNLRNGLELKA